METTFHNTIFGQILKLRDHQSLLKRIWSWFSHNRYSVRTRRSTVTAETMMKFFKKKPSANALLAQELQLALTSAQERIQTLEVQAQREREASTAAEMKLSEAYEQNLRLQESLDVKTRSNETLMRDAIMRAAEARNIRAQNKTHVRERDDRILILQDENRDLQRKIQEQEEETTHQQTLHAQTERELELKEKANRQLQREVTRQKKQLQRQRGRVLTLQERKAALRKELRRTNESSEAFILQHEEWLHEERQEKAAAPKTLETMREELHNLKKSFESQQQEKEALTEAFKTSVEEEAVETSAKEATKEAEKTLEERRKDILREIKKKSQKSKQLQTKFCQFWREFEEQKETHEKELVTLEEDFERSVTESTMKSERSFQNLQTEKEASLKREVDNVGKELGDKRLNEIQSLKMALETLEQAEENEEKKLAALENKLQTNANDSQLKQKIAEIAARRRKLKEELQRTKQALERFEEKLGSQKNMVHAQAESQTEKQQQQVQVLTPALEKPEAEVKENVPQEKQRPKTKTRGTRVFTRTPNRGAT